MNIEEIREYCLAKPGVTEGFPFGEDVLVFKVMNKMFALTGLEGDPPYVNLKCDPERAINLREPYEDIRPGYYMNKVIWLLFSTVKFTQIVFYCLFLSIRYQNNKNHIPWVSL